MQKSSVEIEEFVKMIKQLDLKDIKALKLGAEVLIVRKELEKESKKA